MTTILLALFACGQTPGTRGEFAGAELCPQAKPVAVQAQVGGKTMALFGLAFESKEEAQAAGKWLNDNYAHKRPPKLLAYKIVVEGVKPSAYAANTTGGRGIPLKNFMNRPGTMAKGILYDTDGKDLNAEIIKHGLARTEEKRYEDAQDEAEKKKLGVWARSGPNENQRPLLPRMNTDFHGWRRGICPCESVFIRGEKTSTRPAPPAGPFPGAAGDWPGRRRGDRASPG